MKTDRRAPGAARTIAAMAVFLVACCPNQGVAQRSFRNLTGQVTDQHQIPLKGAVVEVENEATERVVSYITEANGLYSFKRLDGDADYRVWATVHGHRSKIRKLSLFDMGKAKIVNFRIKLQ